MQTVQYEVEVLEVFAQSNIPRYVGIVDDTDMVTVQVIGKVMVVSHAYHTCEVDEDDKVREVIEVIPFVVCVLQAKEEAQAVVVAEEALLVPVTVLMEEVPVIAVTKSTMSKSSNFMS